MANEITIPLLPCHSINEMLDFYRALGFEATYQQSKPNNCAVVVRGGIELHFFSMRDYIPANSYSTCYVRTLEIDVLYREFCEGLKQKYGRVPSAGIPRVLPLKNKTGRREFIVVDPGGNWIRIGQILETSVLEKATNEEAPPSHLSRATHAALLLDEAGYYAQAAQKLDVALASSEAAPTLHRVRALVLRAAIAINAEEYDVAQGNIETMWKIPLTDQERDELKEELQQAEGLSQTISEFTK